MGWPSTAHDEPSTAATRKQSRGNVLIDHLLKVFLRGQPDDLPNDLATLEQEYSRDAANLKLEGRVRVVVHVELPDRHFPRIVACQLVDCRCQTLAGAAPLRPEIHEDRLTGLQHRRFEIRVRKSLHVLG